MRYLLLICGDEAAAAHADDGCGGWDQEMQARGVLRGAAGLHPPTDATTVRVREDRLVLSDGPYAETKEQIGGFCLIECDDLDQAIEVASKHPAARYGALEIRPVRQAPVLQA
ncbi:MAG: transcription initiation protein [Pseudonocardiales bacterium]|nr:MAG: transcription initiation protein [Pseudonocardiales bacterium]